jgi:hypothetical protein
MYVCFQIRWQSTNSRVDECLVEEYSGRRVYGSTNFRSTVCVRYKTFHWPPGFNISNSFRAITSGGSDISTDSSNVSGLAVNVSCALRTILMYATKQVFYKLKYVAGFKGIN